MAEFSGDTRRFTRKGESGKHVHYEFCSRCGTTLCWRLELLPDRQVFAGGVFDDADQFEVVAEMYTDRALSWSQIGIELACPGPPDDQFRKAAIATKKALRRVE